MPRSFTPPLDPLLCLAAVLACGLPTLLAHSLPPSSTLLNQCVAVAAWGMWVAALAPRGLARGIGPLLTALALMAGAVVAAMVWRGLPPSLAGSALGLVAGAALLAVAGADVARRADGPAAASAFFFGLLVAGALGACVAIVQVFAPEWADGQWIAASGLPGRAVGNLRQPNHLCTLLLWGLAGAVVLHEGRWLPRSALVALGLLMVFAVELTASRTGAVGLVVLLAWGLLDRRLSPTARLWLLLLPVAYGLAYGAMAWLGELNHQALGAGARVEAGGLGESGSPNARSNIWRNAWALVLAQPWTGVGFGEFNFAWTLTPFDGRPTAFFDHTHNLMLQLAVELGLPLAGAVLALLAWSLWQAWRAQTLRDGQADPLRGGAQGPMATGRAALVVVLLAGLHSLVEYPLWYAYFLMPTAFAWGLALGNVSARRGAGPADRASSAGSSAGMLAGVMAGVALAAGGAFAVVDYLRVAVIYAPGDTADALENRIARGQRSVFFAHHADYAAATNPSPPDAQALAFARAPHSLLDTRLMVAWAQHLAASGQTDQARWLAARLREFRNPEAQPFFAPCGADRPQPLPFQCEAPRQTHGWRSFLAPSRAALQTAPKAAP